MAEYDRCLEVAAEGLKLAESSGLHILDMLLLGKATLAARHKGDTHAAKNSFRRMASLLPKAMPHDSGFYYNIASWEALEKGDRTRAEQHWSVSTELGLKTGFLAIQHYNLILGVIVKRALGLTREARALLSEARKIESRFRCEVHPYYTTLVESILLNEDGDVPGEVGKLREAMQRGRELGQLGMQFWHPSLHAKVAARALREGIEVPYVQEMIRKNRLLPDPGDLDLEEWPWPVRIYTLGRFNLVVDGAPPPSVRKAPQKPLQLLKALIALGGREVPEEHLGEILWPDADGDLAHESLSSNLKRLRKRLGDDRSVLLRDGRVTLNNRHCWVDAWAFERILGRAGAARKPGAPAPDGREIAQVAEQAIALYRGTFLSGETFCPDIATYRERLRSKFLRTVAQAGRHWEQSGEVGDGGGLLPEGTRGRPPRRRLVPLPALLSRADGPRRRGARRVPTVPQDALGRAGREPFARPRGDPQVRAGSFPARGGGKVCAGWRSAPWPARRSRSTACSRPRRIRPTD